MLKINGVIMCRLCFACMKYNGIFIFSILLVKGLFILLVLLYMGMFILLVCIEFFGREKLDKL